jgi:hypothetical protein
VGLARKLFQVLWQLSVDQVDIESTIRSCPVQMEGLSEKCNSAFAIRKPSVEPAQTFAMQFVYYTELDNYKQRAEGIVVYDQHFLILVQL